MTSTASVYNPFAFTETVEQQAARRGILEQRAARLGIQLTAGLAPMTPEARRAQVERNVLEAELFTLAGEAAAFDDYVLGQYGLPGPRLEESAGRYYRTEDHRGAHR